MGSESAQKRARERKRRERATQRRERREARAEAEAEAPPVDADALMERFRVLSEQRAHGAVDAATYEAERAEIFAALGLDDPKRA